MFDEIREAAFKDELEKLGLAAGTYLKAAHGAAKQIVKAKGAKHGLSTVGKEMAMGLEKKMITQAVGKSSVTGSKKPLRDYTKKLLKARKTV